MKKVYREEKFLPAHEGKPIFPTWFDCPNCGSKMRHRPGDVYRCRNCGGFTRLSVEEPNGD